MWTEMYVVHGEVGDGGDVSAGTTERHLCFLRTNATTHHVKMRMIQHVHEWRRAAHFLLAELEDIRVTVRACNRSIIEKKKRENCPPVSPGMHKKLQVVESQRKA